MKNKLYILLVVVLTAIMVTPTPALAYYGNVTGTVIDSKTSSPWLYGGTVYLYDCANLGGPTIGSGPISTADGTFNVPVNPGEPAGGYLCVQIVFNTGPQGKPNDKFYFTPDGPGAVGAYGIGNVYTDTGPNAVALTDANVQSPNVWLPVALAALAVIVVGGAVLLLRRRRAA